MIDYPLLHAWVANHGPYFIGITGGSSSGKTSTTEEIIELIGKDNADSLSQDDYYKDLRDIPPHLLIEGNFDHPLANEIRLLIYHITQLQQGMAVEVPEYNFEECARKAKKRIVVPHAVVPVEGLHVLVFKQLRDLLDLKVYVDCPAKLRFERRMNRDVNERGRTIESIIKQYDETVYPMHMRYVEPSRKHADIVINSEVETPRSAAIRIIEKMNEMITPRSDESKDIQRFYTISLPHSIPEQA